MDAKKIDQWLEAHKHLQGAHNQKKHGYRGGASVPAGGGNAKYTDSGPKTSMSSSAERAVSVGTNPPKAPPKGYHSGGTKVSQAAQATRHTNHYGEDVKLPKPPKTGEIRPRYQEVLSGLTKAAGEKRHAADQASIDKSIKSTIARIKGSSNVYQGLKPDAKDIKILKDWMKMKIDLQTTFDAMNASDGWAK